MFTGNSTIQVVTDNMQEIQEVESKHEIRIQESLYANIFEKIQEDGHQKAQEELCADISEKDESQETHEKRTRKMSVLINKQYESSSVGPNTDFSNLLYSKDVVQSNQIQPKKSTINIDNNTTKFPNDGISEFDDKKQEYYNKVLSFILFFL